MYGVFFVLMGLFLIVAPKSKGSEKIPLTFEELLVIIGIGAVLILIGALLIRSHFKKRKKIKIESQAGQGGESRLG